MLCDRIRRRLGGAGYAGFHQVTGDAGFPNWGDRVVYTSDNQLGEQPCFVNYEVCVDTGHFRYDPFTKAELWHDFYLDRVQVSRVPHLHGQVVVPGGEGAIPTIVQFDQYVVNRDDWWDDEAEVFDGVIVFPSEEDPFPRPLVEVDQEVFSCSYNNPDVPWGHLDLSAHFSPVTDLLATSNPTKVKVDIPSFLIETLKDLPRYIEAGAQHLLAKVGSTNLQYQFGWKPLVHDVEALMKFKEEVVQRYNTLLKLQAQGVVTTKGRIQKTEVTEEYDYSVSIPWINFNVPMKLKKTTLLEQWGAVRWTVPDETMESLSVMSTNERLWASFKSLYGIFWKNPAAIWELLPWSWFVDWFVPVQNMLRHYSNYFELSPKEIAVMTRTTTTFEVTIVPGAYQDDFPDLPLDTLAFSGTRVTKSRICNSGDGTFPSLPPGRPILDTRQWGILASLLAQRALK